MNFEIAPKSTEIQATWDNAILYCTFLEVDGKRGWRLPTKEELNEIYELENDFEKKWYWSGTDNSGNYAWSRSIGNGIQGNRNKNYSYYYVRAIRDLKDD